MLRNVRGSPVHWRLGSCPRGSFKKSMAFHGRTHARASGIQNPHCISPFAKGETNRGWIPGRATPDCDPGLPGMTIESCHELPSRIRLFRRPG
jgi:hypothetical protein